MKSSIEDFLLYIGRSVVIFSITNLKKIKIMRSYGNRGYCSISLFLYIGRSVVIFSITNLKRIKIMRSYGNRGYSSISLFFIYRAQCGYF